MSALRAVIAALVGAAIAWLEQHGVRLPDGFEIHAVETATALVAGLLWYAAERARKARRKSP